MNYQYYDDNMKKYLEFFKDSSLKVKPEELRDIQKEPVKVKKDDKTKEIVKKQIILPGSNKILYI